MLKPACVACKRFYRPMKNSVRVHEQMPLTNGVKPGEADEDQWGPYKIWRADAWQCHGCGHVLVVGYGRQPEAVKHEPHFALANVLVDYTINDC